jgi:undecaprenyl-diphosphatase
MSDWVYAVILGIVEGLTEFIPVSSTGMMLITKQALGLTDKFWDTFCVLIQLGAILAVVVIYFRRLWNILIMAPTVPRARSFIYSILVAFLPAAVLGALFHDKIKQYLFESPPVVATALVIGGVVLLVIDRFAPYPTRRDVMALPLPTSFAIGLFQCLALIPGVSRSGATIVGSMLMGVEKRVAAEFSFLLAIPVMVGAFTYDAWKSRHELNTAHIDLVAVGFVVAFVVALFVIRGMLAIVTRRGYGPFGWLRIAIGLGVLALHFTHTASF